jgi:hypothetical protein
MTAPAPQELNVIEFKRVSTDRQDKARQDFDLADNRARFNLNVLRTISIKVSGTKVLTNEDVQCMMAELSHPGVDGISTSAIDRIFRPKDYEGVLMLQYFHANKKVIVSTKEGYVEPWTDPGWDICMGAAQKAGSEWREIKRRTSGGRRRAHAQNKPMNTTAPFGLLYLDKYHRDVEGRSQYFIEDPAPSSIGTSRREIVEMIFRWRHVERMKTYQIVRRLNQRGILTCGKRNKDGSWQYEPGLWTRNTVIQLLKNRHYIGEHWEGDVPCPSFVDRNVFEAVQKSFLTEKGKADKEGRPTRHRVLSRFLWCARCNHRMYVHRRVAYYYRCIHFDQKHQKRACDPRNVRCEVIEPLVFAIIWKHITDPALLLRNARAFYDTLPSKSATAKLERELASVQGRIERLQNMVELGTMDAAKGNAKILEAMKRVREIEAELRAAGSVISLPSLRLAEAACSSIAQGPMPTRFETQRPVLEKLVDLKIAYDGATVDITGKVPVEASAERGQKCNGGVRADSQREGVHLVGNRRFWVNYRLKHLQPRAKVPSLVRGLAGTHCGTGTEDFPEEAG